MLLRKQHYFSTTKNKLNIISIITTSKNIVIFINDPRTEYSKNYFKHQKLNKIFMTLYRHNEKFRNEYVRITFYPQANCSIQFCLKWFMI